MTLISPSEQLTLRDSLERRDPLGMVVAGPLQEEARCHVIDAHFHLDRFQSSTGCPGLAELDQMETQHFQTKITHAVANFCFPERYPSSSQRSAMRKSPEYLFAYGIHPRVIHQHSRKELDGYVDQLRDLVKTKKTVAVGECGLDSTDDPRPSHIRRQVTYLELQLQMAAKSGLVVVLHCRGNEELHLQLLDSLVKILPANHPIHWHCFISSHHVFKQITTHFSQIIFGITPFICHGSKATEISKFVRTLGPLALDYIVLESDSPYIPYKGAATTPLVINYVAEELARILNLSLKEICDRTTANAVKIYLK